MRKIRSDSKCEWGVCKDKATTLAYDRSGDKVLRVCENHISSVANADRPEYVSSCPNCGCHHGIA